MKFIVDAQLPPALARWLCEQGHQAEHVQDVGRSNRALREWFAPLLPDMLVCHRALPSTASAPKLLFAIENRLLKSLTSHGPAAGNFLCGRSLALRRDCHRRRRASRAWPSNRRWSVARVLAITGPWFSMDKAIRFYLIALLPAIVAAAFAVLHITSAWLAALRFRLLSRNQIRPANAALSGRRPPTRIWAARIQSARPCAAQCQATTAHPGW